MGFPPFPPPSTSQHVISLVQDNSSNKCVHSYIPLSPATVFHQSNAKSTHVSDISSKVNNNSQHVKYITLSSVKCKKDFT